MSRPQSVCSFCQKPGNSKEHYWGQWTKKHIPSQSERVIHTLRRPFGVSPNTFGQAVFEGPMSRQGEFRGQQIKGVCEPCNNGWMRLIHERAKPHLLRLAAADWWPLSDEERVSVAAYFTLVSMMWQLADRQTMATNQVERTGLMTTRMPPSNWVVLIAEHEEKAWTEKLLHTGFNVDPPDDDYARLTPNSHTLVSTFGKTVFNTLSMGADSLDVLRDMTDNLTKNLGFQMIWPLGGDEIQQPARPHTDEEIQRIANLFYPAVPSQ